MKDIMTAKQASRAAKQLGEFLASAGGQDFFERCYGAEYERLWWGEVDDRGLGEGWGLIYDEADEFDLGVARRVTERRAFSEALFFASFEAKKSGQ